MGSADPRAYSHNKRGIAGSLIWINFDRHALLSLFHKALGKFVADVDEIRPQYQDSSVGSTAVFASSLTRSIGPSVGSRLGFAVRYGIFPSSESAAEFVQQLTGVSTETALLRAHRTG